MSDCVGDSVYILFLYGGFSWAQVLYVIVVGGPCTGKTTIVQGVARQLESKGFKVKIIDDQARLIIREQQRRGGDILPWIDRLRFEEEVVRRHYLEYLKALREKPDVVIDDSGVFTALAYIEVDGLKPSKKIMDIVEKLRGKVDLVLLTKPPSKYHTDSERWEDVEYAKKIHETIKRIHLELFPGKVVLVDSYHNVEDRIREATEKILSMITGEISKGVYASSITR